MEPRESDLDRRQIEMEINRRDRPDRALKITRRTFINKAILAGTAAGAASVGWFPTINTIDLAFGQQAAFKFAWLSDTHLYPKNVNTRFVEKTVRAVGEIKASWDAGNVVMATAILVCVLGMYLYFSFWLV